MIVLATLPAAILGIVVLMGLGYLVYRLLAKSKFINRILNPENPATAVEKAEAAIDTVDAATRQTTEQIEALKEEVAKGDEFLGQVKPDVKEV